MHKNTTTSKMISIALTAALSLPIAGITCFAPISSDGSESVALAETLGQMHGLPDEKPFGKLVLVYVRADDGTAHGEYMNEQGVRFDENGNVISTTQMKEDDDIDIDDDDDIAWNDDNTSTGSNQFFQQVQQKENKIEKAQKSVSTVKMKIKSVKSTKKKRATVSVKPFSKAQKKKVDGYQIQYVYVSDKPQFSAKIKDLVSYKETGKSKIQTTSSVTTIGKPHYMFAKSKTKTIKHLKSGKTLQIKVRAYKNVVYKWNTGKGITRVFGPWSKAVNVKVK